MQEHARDGADGSLCTARAATPHAVEHGVSAWVVLPTHTNTHTQPQTQTHTHTQKHTHTHTHALIHTHTHT